MDAQTKETVTACLTNSLERNALLLLEKQKELKNHLETVEKLQKLVDKLVADRGAMVAALHDLT